MPIEVRELIIKAIVQQDTGSPGAADAKQPNNAVTSNEEIIRASIEKVIEIIKSNNER